MPIQFDQKLGILRSTVKGVQSADDGEAFIGALEKQVAIARARVGRVLHLVDGREAAVQPTSTTSIYSGRAAMGGAGVDKIAVILSSTLVKMQAQRVSDGSPMAVFSDPDEALAWLLAEEPVAARA